MGENGIQVEIETNGIGAFKHNFQKWFWKLVYTAISAKVLITLLAESVATYLAVTVRTVDEVIMGADGSQVVVQVSKPYISGQQWTDVTIAIVVAFIGARVAPTIIRNIGETVSGYYLNKNGDKEDD